MIQLAVSKDGILSGTWLDQATGQSRPLQGMVEQATQKAAWTFADSPTDALVLETSLYNLTEPECTALAHFDAVSTKSGSSRGCSNRSNRRLPLPAGKANRRRQSLRPREL